MTFSLSSFIDNFSNLYSSGKEVLMKNRASRKANEVSRRGFIKASAAAGVAVVLGGQERLFAA
ncbi:MAG: twin-arginine translocation signal domain-containing protein, partial [Planctomycetota bacterium]